MKKIIVVVALIVGCLSCFGGNWKTMEDENVQALSLVGKGNSILSVMKFKDENNSYDISLMVNNLNKIRKSDFIDVYVDGVRFRIRIGINEGEYIVGRISGKQMVTIIEAKKRIRVKYSERTFEFVP